MDLSCIILAVILLPLRFFFTPLWIIVDLLPKASVSIFHGAVWHFRFRFMSIMFGLVELLEIWCAFWKVAIWFQQVLTFFQFKLKRWHEIWLTMRVDEISISYAMSYRSKIILDRPNCFGRVQIILVRFKLDFSRIFFIIWTLPKCFGPNQNKLDPSKMIGTRAKLFGWSKIILDPKKDNELDSCTGILLTYIQNPYQRKLA
jgi:hypothetical protein